MAKNLLIVESPAKAKTIEKYLGKDFSVKSSYGHVRDLSKEKMGVDIENNFTPKYEVSKDKTRVVKELREAVKKSETVWLATDEDREGEAISWHLCKVLGLDENTTKRIVFREITKPALQKAIQSPRLVDQNLVNAQQARRVLDRLVGFELSSLLWKKVKGKLSAGRVQSVAVKLIVDREREIQKHNSSAFFKLSSIFRVKNKQGKLIDLKAELPKKFDQITEANDFLNKCVAADYKIDKIQVRPTKRSPTAPFTTSTLQQEASRKLGFSVSRTMSNAQRLYEQGHITYMRTDSTTLSQEAVNNIANTIEQNYGKQYVQTRQFKGKSQNAQEAHEAIRPTRPERFQVSTNRDEQRLYELIWKRAVASQMAQAQLEKTTVDVGISTMPSERLVANGEVLKFDGFLKVYLESTDDDAEEEAKGMLPPLTVGQALSLKNMTATERFTRHPARFTEAALVKKMEELGIGRPSTYAPTISRITEPSRGYIVKESREGVIREYRVLTLSQDIVAEETKEETTGAEKNKLFPKDLGILVSDFLSANFDSIMNYKFTANIEKQFDGIAAGHENWTDMLSGFYHPFHQTVEKTLEEAERVTGERILGKDPKTGLTLLVRMSRFGPVAQIGASGELTEEQKPIYANLKNGMSLEGVTYEEAIELFKLPKDLGLYEEQMVTIGAGRFGPYIKFDEKYVSIPKGEDPLELTLEQGIELIEEKRRQDAPIGEYEGKPYTKGVGRFGPYFKWNGLFVNIPKRFDPETITEEESIELIRIKAEKEANRYIKQWPEEKVDVQNGRWGPFIKWNKKNIKFPKKEDGTRVTREDVQDITLEEVKKLVIEEHPEAFKKKTRKKAAPKKKAPAKKATAKKTTAKKAPAKKTTAKKK